MYLPINPLLRISFVFFLFTFISCKPEKQPKEQIEKYSPSEITLSKEEMYDKVLGMLVGSAIGDAMGAPTEMWPREEIWIEYGWVNKLDSMVRETSPEGIWKANLPAGGTTDDTRWKVLIMEYLGTQDKGGLNELRWARHIYEEFHGHLLQFKKLDPNNPEDFERQQMKVWWLQEWAKVAKPLLDNDLMAYNIALNKFYGGEMVCGGLLYSPAIGLFFPQQPEKAYQEAFKLSLFDIGYAKDLSALSAAMTSAAMHNKASPEKMLETIRSLDPENYFESRLVGRVAYRILKQALEISAIATKESNPEFPFGKDEPGVMKAFELLDHYHQDMPFHAGEIFLQVLTAMIFTEFNFEKTLQFLVNYGRDNDTTASLAGAILGTLWGFEALPDQLKNICIDTNKNELGIDLEELAERFVKKR